MEAKTLRKYDSKSVSDLIKIATRHFNKFIRNRDSNEGCFKCISCSKVKPNEKLQAGHFRSAGHYPSVRFNEKNVHGQCKRCNLFLSGNLADYAKNLTAKIGTEGMQEIEDLVGRSKQLGFKWDRISLIETIEKYKKLNKEL